MWRKYNESLRTKLQYNLFKFVALTLKGKNGMQNC